MFTKKPACVRNRPQSIFLMLRKTRLIIAALFFAAVTLLFVDFSGEASSLFGWTAKLQFLPALLAMNFAVIAGIALLTIIFGRIYCSVICPLGVMQDIFSRTGNSGKKNRFSYKKGKTVLRWTIFAVFAALMLSGGAVVATLIAPYSAYGRIASNILAPIWAAGNNLLADLCEYANSYALYQTDIWFKGTGAFLVALATLAIIGCISWKHGRAYCNTVCPVGTLLGFLARYSLFRPVIDASKCVGCKLCEKNCKSKCINAAEHSIDYDRCVACFNCLEQCRTNAITYTARRSKAGAVKSGVKTAPKSAPKQPAKKRAKAERDAISNFAGARRLFFKLVFLIGGGTLANAQVMKLDGGLAPIKPRHKPPRKTRILPPGAVSFGNFDSKCTSCMLCVSACPTHVLEPSASLSNFMRPEVSYERGYCRTECVKCSQVCPAGAILPISPEVKASTQTGHAVWVSASCIVNTDSVQCDNCFAHCPTMAIQMVPKDVSNPKSLKIPVVNEARCIGCGACENLCPARPVSAIYVEGHEVHKEI